MSRSELDVPKWLIPRLELLTARGEDINGVCGPNNATVLQTAVSLLLLHDAIVGGYRWRGTVLFDALVSFNARLDIQGPYGNILEQFWMQIHSSDVLYSAMEDDHSEKYEAILDDCRGFIHRLIGEFGLNNCRADPNGKIPTVEAMKRFGCNYENPEGIHSRDAVSGSWYSYEQEKKYFYDCNAGTRGTRVAL